MHPKDVLQRYQEQKQQQQTLQEKALNEASQAAWMLVNEFGAENVYLFGPLTYGGFTEGMAIDLAVEGLPLGTLASALAHLRQISQFGVELTDYDTADSWSKRAIAQTGKLLAQKSRCEDESRA